jgi:hypothetical protein
MLTYAVAQVTQYQLEILREGGVADEARKLADELADSSRMKVGKAAPAAPADSLYICLLCVCVCVCVRWCVL